MWAPKIWPYNPDEERIREAERARKAAEAEKAILAAPVYVWTDKEEDEFMRSLATKLGS